MVNVKLNIGREVVKQFPISTEVSSKCSINPDLFNFRNGGTSLINIKYLGDFYKSHYMSFIKLRNICLLLNRVTNNLARLKENNGSLDIDIKYPENPKDTIIKIVFIKNNSTILNINWNIEECNASIKLYKTSSTEASFKHLCIKNDCPIDDDSNVIQKSLMLYINNELDEIDSNLFLDSFLAL